MGTSKKSNPYGKMGHPPSYTGKLPSAEFDWDTAINKLYETLAEVYGR